MSEENKQAETGVTESELPDTWDEAAKPAGDAVKDEPKAEDADTEEPDGDAEEADEAEGDEGEAEPDDKPKKPSRSERLRRQNERLKAEIEALKSGSAIRAVEGEGNIDALVTERLGPEPKEEDFNGDWLKYDRAVAAYEAAKLTMKVQIKDQQRQQEKIQSSILQDKIDDYVERCEEVSKTLTDFKKVVTSPDFVTSDLVKTLILDAGEKAPLVAYHLAQNPKLTARINALPPVEAAREIGRIEGRVSLPTNKATRAPAPVNPVKGSASPTRGLGKSMSDYERWRNS